MTQVTTAQRDALLAITPGGVSIPPSRRRAAPDRGALFTVVLCSSCIHVPAVSTSQQTVLLRNHGKAMTLQQPDDLCEWSISAGFVVRFQHHLPDLFPVVFCEPFQHLQLGSLHV